MTHLTHLTHAELLKSCDPRDPMATATAMTLQDANLKLDGEAPEVPWNLPWQPNPKTSHDVFMNSVVQKYIYIYIYIWRWLKLVCCIFQSFFLNKSVMSPPPVTEKSPNQGSNPPPIHRAWSVLVKPGATDVNCLLSRTPSIQKHPNNNILLLAHVTLKGNGTPKMQQIVESQNQA